MHGTISHSTSTVKEPVDEQFGVQIKCCMDLMWDAKIFLYEVAYSIDEKTLTQHYLVVPIQWGLKFQMPKFLKRP